MKAGGWVAAALASLGLSCAATPEPGAPEELLFEVPSWCTWGYQPPLLAPHLTQGTYPPSPPRMRGPARYNPARPRGQWTGWARSFQAPAEGRALCGVKLPAGDPAGDEGEPGLCMEVLDGRILAWTVLDGEGKPRPGAVMPLREGSAWRELRLAGPSRLHVRVEGRMVQAYLEGSGREVRGPCFHGEPGEQDP